MGFSFRRVIKSVQSAARSVEKAVVKEADRAVDITKKQIGHLGNSLDFETLVKDPKQYHKNIFSKIGEDIDTFKDVSRSVQKETQRASRDTQRNVSSGFDEAVRAVRKLPGGERVADELDRSKDKVFEQLRRSGRRINDEYHRNPDTYGTAIIVLLTAGYYLAVAGAAPAAAGSTATQAAASGLETAVIVDSSGSLITPLADVVAAQAGQAAAQTAAAAGAQIATQTGVQAGTGVLSALGKELLLTVVEMGVGVGIAQLSKPSKSKVTETEAEQFNNDLGFLANDINGYLTKPKPAPRADTRPQAQNIKTVKGMTNTSKIIAGLIVAVPVGIYLIFKKRIK